MKNVLFPLFLLIAAHVSTCAVAKSVSPEEALGKALRFMQPHSHRSRGVSIRPTTPHLTLTHTAAAGDETYYYVFNNADGGYVVVGGDDVAHDVLAYGESGTFDPDNMPAAMRWWLSLYEGQIHRAIQAERRQEAGTNAEASDRREIQPLLGKTEWFQDLPYSAYILNNVELAEADADEYYPTGCVATALAQVMRYWRYPQHGMASHSYRYRGNIFEADFSKADYKWDLMKDTYPFAYMGTPEEDAVAELMNAQEAVERLAATLPRATCN